MKKITSTSRINIIFCLAVPPTCPDISAPTNGFITTENVDTFYEGIKIQFACNAGFTLTGKSITTCHIGRGELLWSHSPPTCESK